MLEAGVLVNQMGAPIYWHAPPHRSSVYIPDSVELWDVVWENRSDILGFAHSHPGNGSPWPSSEDLSTFHAWEQSLGRTLRWWITTSDCVMEFRRDSWMRGNFRCEYALDMHTYKWLGSLRSLSRF